jgi:hypothetical protein
MRGRAMSEPLPRLPVDFADLNASVARALTTCRNAEQTAALSEALRQTAEELRRWEIVLRARHDQLSAEIRDRRLSPT